MEFIVGSLARNFLQSSIQFLSTVKYFIELFIPKYVYFE